MEEIARGIDGPELLAQRCTLALLQLLYCTEATIVDDEATVGLKDVCLA